MNLSPPKKELVKLDTEFFFHLQVLSVFCLTCHSRSATVCVSCHVSTKLPHWVKPHEESAVNSERKKKKKRRKMLAEHWTTVCVCCNHSLLSDIGYPNLSPLSLMNNGAQWIITHNWVFPSNRGKRFVSGTAGSMLEVCKDILKNQTDWLKGVLLWKCHFFF